MTEYYRLRDKHGIVHLQNPDATTAVYTQCERDDQGYVRPKFFGDDSLGFTDAGPTCLACVLR